MDCLFDQVIDKPIRGPIEGYEGPFIVRNVISAGDFRYRGHICEVIR